MGEKKGNKEGFEEKFWIQFRRRCSRLLALQIDYSTLFLREASTLLYCTPRPCSLHSLCPHEELMRVQTFNNDDKLLPSPFSRVSLSLPSRLRTPLDQALAPTTNLASTFDSKRIYRICQVSCSFPRSQRYCSSL